MLVGIEYDRFCVQAPRVRQDVLHPHGQFVDVVLCLGEAVVHGGLAKMLGRLICRYNALGVKCVPNFLTACKNTNRKFSGCEINETYYKMSLEKVK